MTPAFADSFLFLAMLTPGSFRHAESIQWLNNSRRPLVLTVAQISEQVTALARVADSLRSSATALADVSLGMRQGAMELEKFATGGLRATGRGHFPESAVVGSLEDHAAFYRAITKTGGVHRQPGGPDQIVPQIFEAEVFLGVHHDAHHGLELPHG